MQNLLLSIVSLHEAEWAAHVFQLERELLFLLKILFDGGVLDAEDVLEELPARVNPMEVEPNSARGLPIAVGDLELDPFIMLILVTKDFHVYLTLAKDAA